MDSSNRPPPRANLTFEVVDDLVGAHARGRLNGAPQVRYAATDMCPLIELMMEASSGVEPVRYEIDCLILKNGL